MNCRTPNTLKSGFEKFVVRNKGQCWGWKGCAPKNPGYGQYRVNCKLVRAHRASWMLHDGDIPKDIFVCHKCDNPICSNPDHLFLDSCKGNNHDMMKKNRHPTLGKKGADNHMAKLNEEKVAKIRELKKNGLTNSEVAKKFNVTPGLVSKINNRILWG